MKDFKIKLDIRRIRSKIPSIMAASAKSGVRIIKREIDRLDLVKTGALRGSVSSKHGKTYVKFKVAAAHAKYLDAGVRRHRMVNLTSAVGPIPMKSGRKISFRMAPKSTSKFRWIHPGFRRGRGFISRCRDSIISEISQRVAKLELF